MNEDTKSLIREGINSMRSRLTKQLKNAFKAKLELIEEHDSNEHTVQFIEEFEKELRKIRFDLMDLSKTEKELETL